MARRRDAATAASTPPPPPRLQIAFNAEGHWITQRVHIPDGLQCVLFIPDDEMPTTEARAVLPAKIDRKDAIFNIARASMLINCFAT